MPLKHKIVEMPKQKPRPKVPLWKGPETDGVTFSLLNNYIMDKERFRLKVVHGLVGKEGFNHRIEYGNMWHACEEAYHRGKSLSWRNSLATFTSELIGKYPLFQEEIIKYSKACQAQFQVFVEYERKLLSPKNQNDTYLFKEQPFQMLYDTGRNKVYLRGVWDGIFHRKKGKKVTIWVRENKTKGDIKEQQITRQLKFDLQTMIYVVAMMTCQFDEFKQELGGVLYNVIRRPFSGGRGNITRHKAKDNKLEESEQSFFQRLVDDYIAKEPEYWFMQWDVPISLGDVEVFKRECLNPLLDDLCKWWRNISTSDHGIFPVHVEGHYRMPFGVYSPIADGRGTVYDDFLETGSMTGLDRTETLFPEIMRHLQKK